MRVIRKMRGYFYKTPIILTILVTLAISFVLGMVGWIANMLQGISYFTLENAVGIMIGASPLVLSTVLTVENVLLLFRKSRPGQENRAIKGWEVAAIVVGGSFSFLYLGIMDIQPKDWHVQLYNGELHTPIATGSFLTIGAVTGLGVLGYGILRFFSLEKLPPLLAVLCISALYLGMAVALLWCLQVFQTAGRSTLLLCVFPFNCIVIAIRTIQQVVRQQVYRTGTVSKKYVHLARLLERTANWPWLAFLAALPLLGIVVAVLLLFGQEPDSFIKAWTETANWNFSQKVAPPNLVKDEHYLCTVAAGGHPKVVKPLRTGKRHGHEVIVNRQLEIANAFEQLLEERLPRFHRVVRTTYDTVGYPIARHIRSPYMADAVYFLMKPLEWLFLIVLYLFDAKPENRIAVQYPHSDPYGAVESE